MKQLLASTLAALLMFPAWATAQAPGAPSGAPQLPAMLPGSLKILVLEGQGAMNNVEKGLATPPVIEVRDRDDRPVESATVVFRLPPVGPSGAFSGQQLSKTVMTNVQGQAIASGFTPNKLTGDFKIHVTATAGSRMGEVDVLQTNTAAQFSVSPEPPHKKMKWWKWAVIGGVALGVTAVVVVLATRGKSSTSSSNPTITITPGPVGIGGN